MGRLLFVGLLTALAALGQSKPVQHGSPELSALRRSLSPVDALQFDEFTGFMQKHQREYKDAAEVRHRFGVFQENLKLIDQMQKREKGTAKYAVTAFADKTREERIKFGTGLKMPKKMYTPPASDFQHFLKADVPEALDLRNEGLVGPVKDQGWCGSCFMFAAIGALEGAWAKKTGEYVALSEQQTLDCFPFEKCGGGFPAHAYLDIAWTGGLESAIDYPYTSGSGHEKDTCDLIDPKKFVVNGTLGAGLLPLGIEELLAPALNEIGPININIDADYIFFYSGGVVDVGDFDHDGEQVNHAVLLVGYGEENGVPYWIVKNSWSSDWGEDGYFRVVRNKNSLYLTDTPSSYPLV